MASDGIATNYFCKRRVCCRKGPSALLMVMARGTVLIPGRSPHIDSTSGLAPAATALLLLLPLLLFFLLILFLLLLLLLLLVLVLPLHVKKMQNTHPRIPFVEGLGSDLPAVYPKSIAGSKLVSPSRFKAGSGGMWFQPGWARNSIQTRITNPV
jgi:hypothetical protein